MFIIKLFSKPAVFRLFSDRVSISNFLNVFFLSKNLKLTKSLYNLLLLNLFHIQAF